MFWYFSGKLRGYMQRCHWQACDDKRHVTKEKVQFLRQVNYHGNAKYVFQVFLCWCLQKYCLIDERNTYLTKCPVHVSVGQFQQRSSHNNNTLCNPRTYQLATVFCHSVRRHLRKKDQRNFFARKQQI